VIKASYHWRLPFPGCVAVYSSVCAGTKYKLNDNVSLSFCMNMVLSFVTTSMYSKTTKAVFLLGIFNKPFLEMYKSWLLRVLNF
jgi:hypothetical protein